MSEKKLISLIKTHRGLTLDNIALQIDDMTKTELKKVLSKLVKEDKLKLDKDDGLYRFNIVVKTKEIAPPGRARSPRRA